MAFVKEINSNIRKSKTLQSKSTETVKLVSRTISSLGPKACEILPTELKIIVNPTLFKKRICK